MVGLAGNLVNDLRNVKKITLFKKQTLKKYILEQAKLIRPQFSRIGDSFIEDLEIEVKTSIKNKLTYKTTESKTLR